MSPSKEEESRAAALADQAAQLLAKGQKEDAFRTLREAGSIAPDHPRIREVFLQLQADNFLHPFLKLCRQYASQPSDEHADDVCRYLEREHGQLPDDSADECVAVLLEACAPHGVGGDRIVSTLLKYSPQARQDLAAQLAKTTTDTLFNRLWDTGDGAIDGLAAVLVDPAAWSSETTRQRCEGDVLMLLIAKLMEAGQDAVERGLQGLGVLMLSDAERLYPLVDAEGLAVILSSLDPRTPAPVRSQATLITTKYLEASKEAGQDLLFAFIRTQIDQTTPDKLIVAFAVAAVVFPLVPASASVLFLAEGFVESVVGLLVRKGKSTKVRQAALEMFSAACLDQACRDRIRQSCAPWLEEQVKTAPEPIAGTAALVLAKVHGAGVPRSTMGSAGNESMDVQRLVDKFKGMMRDEGGGDGQQQQRSIEGLAYTSATPAVKEALAHDPAFLASLVRHLQQAGDQPAPIFGVLTILANLTQSPARRSEEQKQMAQLRAYANANAGREPPADDDPLEDATHVAARCQAVLDSGVVPALATIAKHVTARSMALLVQLLLSLSQTATHRGRLAQQGAIKLLLQLYESLKAPSSPTQDVALQRTAAHALARILISIDPALVFDSSGAPPMTSAVRPLALLLDEGELELSPELSPEPGTADRALTPTPHHDLLPTFEALMALTNLASTTDDAVAHAIRTHCWARTEDLLLSENILVRQAAAELVCNLVQSEACAADLFSDYDASETSNHGSSGSGSGSGSGSSSRRLHILLALADVDDPRTRRAASAALATLLGTGSPARVRATADALMTHARAVPVLLRLCRAEAEDDDADEALLLRAIICLACLVDLPSSGPAPALARRAARAIRDHGGVLVLREALVRSRNEQVRLLLPGLLEAVERADALPDADAGRAGAGAGVAAAVGTGAAAAGDGS
ncbi:MAG: hypothetical protein M1826_005245 [Phylliscum demangeonii]|nr:MAG: hypothetical protein M1826_005245 [Phylliscum demangeonii]